MSLNPSNSVLLTRTLKTYKRQASLIAPLSSRFFSLLQSAEGRSLRLAYRACLADPDVLDADAVLEAHFESPPVIALVQGNVDLSNLLNATTPGMNGDTGSLASSVTSSPVSSFSMSRGNSWSKDLAPDDLREVILLPYNLHQTLESAASEADLTLQADSSVLVLATLIVETAHWLYTRVHGYTPWSSEYRNSNGSGETALAKRKEGDLGIKALAAMLGADYELITFSDGTLQLVKHRLPASSPPLLGLQTLIKLLAAAPSPTFDATAFGPTALLETPPWAAQGGERKPAVTIMRVGRECHHGVCKA